MRVKNKENTMAQSKTKATKNSSIKAAPEKGDGVDKKVLSVADIEKICNIFRILADPTRMKIVFALMDKSACVNQLLEYCDGTQSAISHQLRILRDNKIVKAKRMGQSVEYSIADSHVREIVEMGVAHIHCATEVDKT